MIDPSGIYGSLLSYSLTIAFAGSAFMVFLYLWKTGRLGLDEDAKDEMMKQNEESYE